MISLSVHVQIFVLYIDSEHTEMHFAFRVIGDALYMIAMCVFAILFARIRLFFFLQKIIGI